MASVRAKNDDALSVVPGHNVPLVSVTNYYRDHEVMNQVFHRARNLLQEFNTLARSRHLLSMTVSDSLA